MTIGMNAKKKVIEFITKNTKEASGEWYALAYFMEDKYESEGFCILSDTNLDFMEFSNANHISIVEKRMVKISNGEVLLSYDGEQGLEYYCSTSW